MSMFFAMRDMIKYPIVSMKTEGLFWFKDLTVPDPYVALPIITSATLYVMLKYGVEFGQLFI